MTLSATGHARLASLHNLHAKNRVAAASTARLVLVVGLGAVQLIDASLASPDRSRL